MRIVVTGASGFIGGHLIRALAHSHDVIGVSRSVSSGTRVRQVAAYSEAPAGDVLVHLANKRDRDVSSDEEADAIATVRALLQKGFAKAVYVSSGAVYGDRITKPRRVEESVVATGAYTRMKIACETLVREANGVVVRLGNTYGEGMAEANVVSTVLSQVPGTGPLKVRDDRPVRDFVWIEDVVSALEAMIERAGTGTYNVGTGVGTSIGQIARLALSAADQAERPVVATKPHKEDSHLVLDIVSTMQEVAWAPGTPIEEGIKRLVARKSSEQGR